MKTGFGIVFLKAFRSKLDAHLSEMVSVSAVQVVDLMHHK